MESTRRVGVLIPFKNEQKGLASRSKIAKVMGRAAEKSSKRRMWFLYKQPFPMALIVMLCLFGCAVTQNDPSQSSLSPSGDTRTSADPDVAGCDSRKGIVVSPDGRSLGSMSFTPIDHAHDSNQVAGATHADGEQSAVRQSLLSVSIWATISSRDVIGDAASEAFSKDGVAANFRLPWAWYSPSGWGAGARLLASAGALYGAGKTAGVVSLIPLVAHGSQTGKYMVDMGAGVPLFNRLSLGYRYLHYSDAGINGPHTIGADLHMLELSHRF
jgi:hypothetical protein